MSSIFKAFRSIAKPSKAASELANKTSPTGADTNPVDDQTTPMATTQVILNNGLRMPRMGLGTYGVKDKALCLGLFRDALAKGYRMFDTGTMFGNEEFIGNVVFDKLNSRELKRDEVFIGTKVAPFEHGKSQTRTAILGSLKRLKLSHVDLVLVHWPGVAKVPPQDPRNKIMRTETWTELENLVDEGKVKAIGVSNYTENHLKDLLGHCRLKPTVNQVEFHPMCYQKQLLDFCKQNSIYLQAYSSLGSSQSKPPGWTVLFNNETVKSIASKHNRPVAQILLRWGLQHDCLLIPKTSRAENLETNLNIFDFSLDDDDMGKLNALNQDKHFCWNPASIV